MPKRPVFSPSTWVLIQVAPRIDARHKHFLTRGTLHPPPFVGPLCRSVGVQSTTQPLQTSPFCHPFYTTRPKRVCHALRHPEGKLISDLILPTPPRAGCKRTRGHLKAQATKLNEAVGSLFGPRIFGYAWWEKGWVNVSSVPGLPQSKRLKALLLMSAQSANYP